MLAQRIHNDSVSMEERMRPNSLVHGLFVIYCALAGIDFKAKEAGSSAYQFVIGICACAVFVLIVLGAKKPRYTFPAINRITWLWWIYLLTTPFVALWRGVPIGHYLRVALPQFLMGESLIIGRLLLGESPQNARLIFRGLFYASAASSVIYLIRGFTMGLTIEQVRYYILSELLIVLFAFSAYRLLVEGVKAGWISLAGLAGSLMIIFLSLTRTFFTAIAAILIAIAHMVIRPPQWLTKTVQRRVWGNLVVIGFLAAIFAIAVVVFFPSQIEAWTVRSSSIGSQDPTALTRIAEAAGELEVMIGDTSHFLFGAGLGSDHRYDPRFLLGVAAVEGQDLTAYTYQPGHVGWVYQLYAAGCILGLTFPVVLGFSVWFGSLRNRPYIARIAGATMVGVVMMTTFANMLGDRGGGLGLGLLITLCLYSDIETMQATKAPGRRRFGFGRRRPMLVSR